VLTGAIPPWRVGCAIREEAGFALCRRAIPATMWHAAGRLEYTAIQRGTRTGKSLK
jgi:hypothetical protein